MPRQFSNLYTLGFVGAVGMICALLLALAAEGLRPFQERNAALDKRRNILAAFGVFGDEPGQLPVRADLTAIQEFYDANITAMLVDIAGRPVDDAGVDPTDIDLRLQARDKPREDWLLPVFTLRDEAGEATAYALPLAGQGLWGPIYGFLALESDLDTVRGITFYQHQETPGLGAEIESAWFRGQFPERRIWRNGRLVGIRTVKVGTPKDADHEVDAIGGATGTSRAVSDILTEGLRKYETWMRRQRGELTDEANHGR